MSEIKELLSTYNLSDLIIILGLAYFAFYEIRKHVKEQKKEKTEELTSFHKQESEKEEKEETVNERLDSIESKLASDYSRIQKSESHLYNLETDVKEIKTDVLDMRIENMRSSILEAVQKCIDINKPVSAEYYRSIFKIYKKYEKILEKNDLENGECELAMKMIKHSYTQRLAAENFTENQYLSPEIAKAKIKKASDAIPGFWEDMEDSENDNTETAQ